MIRLLMYIFPFLFLAVACEEPVDLVFDELDPKMVVICHFAPDSVFKVVVSTTQSPTDINDTINYLRDLTPKLRLIDGSESTYLQDLEPAELTATEIAKGIPPYYVSQVKAEAGYTYQLNINNASVDAISAIETVPTASVAIETSVKIESRKSTINGFEEVNFRIKLTIHDQAHRQNFYHLDISQELLRWKIGTDGSEIILDRDNPEILPSLAFQIADNDQEVLAYINNRGVLIKDDNFNGESPIFEFQGVLRFDPKRFVLGDFVAEMRNTSEDYYLYHSSLVRQIEVQGGFDPIAGAVILYNNIEDGCGIFAGYHPTFQDIKIEN